MNNSIRRSAPILLFLFLALACLSLPLGLTANAETTHWYSPTCEVVFDNTSAVSVAGKSTELRYSNGQATLVSTYQLHAANTASLGCTLPVFGRLCEFPSTSVSIAYKGSSVADTVSFDYSSMYSGFFESESLNDVLAFRAKVAEVDLSAPIHEYNVKASESTTLSFTLAPTNRLLYVFSTYSHSSADRRYDVNLAAEQFAHLVVFGDALDIAESDTYTVEVSDRVTVGDYYESVLADYISVMSEGLDCSSLLLYRLGEFLASEYGVMSEFSLLDSCFVSGYAYHNFTLPVDAGDSTLTVSQPLHLGINGSYTPTVYVGKIFAPASSAPFTFTVSTDEYVLESTLALTDKSYTGNSVESITIALCSVQKPDLIGGGNQPKYPAWLIAVECLCGVIAAGLITYLVITLVRYKKSKKSAE